MKHGKIETYTIEEFAEAFWRRGYGKKKQALAWLNENGIETPTEDDFMHCYHAVQERPIRKHNSRYIAFHLDGQNPVSPSSIGNSRGKSFAAEMAEEMREMDKLDKWIKRKKETNDEV